MQLHDDVKVARGTPYSYIFLRGDIDWNGRVNDTVNEWKKWRIEARNEIAKGEKEWEAAGRGFQTEMNAWQEESSQTAGKRAQARSEEELKKKIAEYTKSLKKSLPGAMDIEIDADEIARKYATNNIAGLGVLTDSAKQADTTMGFTALFDLGISTGKYKAAFDEQMKTYADRMETMQTVRMAEGAYQAFQGMLASFAESLAESNKGNYGAVDTDIRQTMREEGADKKFKRGDGTWSIRVVSDYSIAKGTEHKTIRWTDYQDYLNTTVFLKPLKALDGSTIDFNSPATYEDLDLTMMQAYSKLEEQAIMNEINAVFAEGGKFAEHSSKEFARLGDDFSDAYMEYIEGEQKKDAGVLNAPIVPGVPLNIKTVGIMAAGIAGGPWAAFALATVMTMGEVAAGDMSIKEGAFQVGMNLATTGLTFGAGNAFGGNILAQQLASTAGSTLLSGAELNSHGKLGYDTERMKDADTWTDAGKSFAISYAASTMQAGFKQSYGSSFAGALASGSTKMLMTAGLNGNRIDWKAGAADTMSTYMADKASEGLKSDNKYTQSLIKNFTSYTVSNLAYNAMGREQKFDLNQACYVNTLDAALQSTKAWWDQKNGKTDPNEAQQTADNMDKADTFLGGIWLGIKNSAMSVVRDSMGIVGGINDFAQSTFNWASGDGFRTNTEVAVAAALGEYDRFSKDYDDSKAMWASGEMDARMVQKMSGDVTGNFYNDSTEVTEAKIAMMEQMGYDTSMIRGQVGGMRADLYASTQNPAIDADMTEVAVTHEEMGPGEKIFSAIGDVFGPTAAYAGEKPEYFTPTQINAAVKLQSNILTAITDIMPIAGQNSLLNENYSGLATQSMMPFYGYPDIEGVDGYTHTGNIFTGMGIIAGELGQGNIMWNGNKNVLNFYAETPSGSVFQGNQYSTKIVDTGSLTKMAHVGTVATTLLSITSDFIDYRQGIMDEEEFAFKSVANTSFAALSFTPLAPLTIPASIAYNIGGQTLYNNYMEGIKSDSEEYKKMYNPLSSQDFQKKFYNAYIKRYDPSNTK